MGEMIDTTPITEKAVLVGLITEDQDEKQAREYLSESFLTDTAGAVVLKHFCNNDRLIRSPLWTRKLKEIADYIKVTEADTSFSMTNSPTQLRNIERELQCKIRSHQPHSRYFCPEAKAAYAKTQVELAQCQYLLPRLTRMWNSTSSGREEVSGMDRVKAN